MSPDPTGRAEETDPPSAVTDDASTPPDADSIAEPESEPLTADATATATEATAGDRRFRDRARAAWARTRTGAARRGRIMVRSRAFWAVVAIMLVGATLWQRCGLRGCPSVATLASYQPGGASVLLDRTGERFADLGPVDHAVVEIESLPDHVAAAFVAVEDKRFYRHDGVDWRRVLGALVANVKARRTVQGSSTITMQLSRNLFPERIRAADRTLRRKLLEVRVSRDIERRFTKDEVLELYLNHIYFGAGAYGVEAASRQYFGRSAKDLTLEQAAMLAALPKAPSHYDPRRNADRARTRRDLVLALMADQEHITVDAAERARRNPIRLAAARSQRERAAEAAYFVQAVRDILEERLGEDVYSRPLRIRTTLDRRAQRAAEEELERQIKRVESGAYGRFAGPRLSQHRAGSTETEYLQGATIMLDNGTGDVLALVGGRDARHSSFNRATMAQRQAGSAFKPFVYATALERGWSLSGSLDDSPYRLVSDGKPWEPANYDGDFLGPISMRDALVFSRNVPTIRLADEVGERNVAKLARAAGIRAPLRETPMIALGIAEVSPLELTSAYTAFAGEGQAVAPRFVLSVEDADGTVIWEPPVEQRRVVDPAVAYMMTDLLRDAVNRGTGRSVRSAGYRGLAAGKTGTTNDGADTWFIGYTPRVTTGVWVGFDRPRPIAEKASGGSVAAYAWGRTINRVASWAGGSPWERPRHIVQVALDPESGLALADGCAPHDGEARTELFREGRAPREVCPERARRQPRASWLDRAIAWAGDVIGGSGSAREVRVARRSDDDDDRARERDERERARAHIERERERERRPERERTRSRGSEPAWAEPWLEARRRAPRADEWAGNTERALREAWDRRVEQERAIEWLRDVAESLHHSLDQAGHDGTERVRDWLEEAVRALDEAGRASRRHGRERVEPWLEELRRDQDRGRRGRRQINAEVQRTLHEVERAIAILRQ